MSKNLTPVEREVLGEFTAYAEAHGKLMFHNERDIYPSRDAQQNAKRRALARLAKKGYLRLSQIGIVYALPASTEVEALQQAMDEAVNAIRKYGIFHTPGLLDQAEMTLRKELYAWNKTHSSGYIAPDIETF